MNFDVTIVMDASPLACEFEGLEGGMDAHGKVSLMKTQHSLRSS
jgi:hypothetical protein